jgi:hypothetical protein
MLTFLLKQRGWKVVYLGARVPAARMEKTIAAVRPNLVILTAQHLSTATTLFEVAQLLQHEQVSLAYGGRIFNLVPTLRQRIPGHFLGERLETAPQNVEQLLSTSPPLPGVDAISEEYHRALAHFRERQTLLEAEMWGRVEWLGLSSAHFSIANEALASNITAALALGDMNYLCTDIKWVAGLLENHQIPGELLSNYLNAYYEAAQVHLDARGRPVLDWLATLNGTLNAD